MGFGCLALLVLLVCGFSIQAMADAHEKFHDFVTGINARALLVAGIRSSVDDRAIAIRNQVMANRAEDTAAEKARVTRAHQAVGGRLEKLTGMVN
jgi:methyl-accepting chemotaxis protein-1 (serine sensor receptor)